MQVLSGPGVSAAAGAIDYMCPDELAAGAKKPMHPALERFELDDQGLIFDLTYFREKPEPFYAFLGAELKVSVGAYRRLFW